MRFLALKISVGIVAVFWLVMLVKPDLLVPQKTATEAGKALIGGPFSLIDHRGKPFTHDNLKGHYSLIYFGFTHCPDICPTTMLVVKNALEQLGSLGDKVQPILISVDPERDTPESMAQYVKNFHPKLIGLTGTPEQITQVANAYKVFFSKAVQPGSAMEYLVDHSGFLFLMDKNGEYVEHFPHTVAEQTLVDTLRRVINR